MFLSYVKTLVGGPERIAFVVNPYSGALLGVPQIAAELEPAHNLGELPWRLPPVPNDPKAALWPGSGRTLYSMGQRSTRVVLEHIARELRLVGGAESGQQLMVRDSDIVSSENGTHDEEESGFLGKLFKRGSVSKQEA